MVYMKGESYKNVAPLWKYLAISFSNVAATFCQYEALKWVSFPVQMLGKSFKMMPVMVWSIAISGKKYGIKDWAIAAAVTFGVTEFLMTGNISSKSHKTGETDTSIYGLLLLLGFLGCDGFTSTFQEKLFAEGKGSKYNQMLYVNAGSAVVSLLSLVMSGSLFSASSFCLKHPLFFAHAMCLSAAAVLGQFCIYSQVKEFGALVFAMTMNLRQVISILVSYLMYGHSITALQVFGLLAVFGALFYKSATSTGGKHVHSDRQAVPTKADEESLEFVKDPEPVKIGNNDEKPSEI
jgi:adenosine 3'-phospho 5'-phosphosulfate transporter B2